MAKPSSPQLVLFSLLVGALGSQANLKISLRILKTDMNWTEARRSCQEKYIDLVSESVAARGKMLGKLALSDWNSSVWMGLHRDPAADPAWKWINVRTGEGLTESDVSNDTKWTPGDPDPHCAAVGDANQTWHSQFCSTPTPFYCSSQGNVTFVELRYSWDAAASHCQSSAMTLAAVTPENSAQFNKKGWIGLRREGGDTWKWSDGSPAAYTNWAAGEPRSSDCGSINRTLEQWNSNECSQQLRGLCYTDNLLVVKLNKTWEEAVAHCRQLENNCTGDSCEPTYDLVTSKDDKDNLYIGHKMDREGTTDEVWVAPRFLAGEWWGLDGEFMSNEETLPNSPSQRERCVAVPKHNYKTWLLRDCSERRNFICYQK